MLVAKKVLSKAYFSPDKRRVLSRQKCACRNKSFVATKFVATKLILMTFECGQSAVYCPGRTH